MKINTLLQVGFFGALLTSISELLFHYVPWSQASSLLEQQTFLQGVSETHLLLGYGIILLFLPLYFFGYLGVFLWIKEVTHKSPYIVLGLSYWMLTLGIMWISARPVVVLLIQHKYQLELFATLHDVTITVVRGLLFLSSVALLWYVRKTQYFKLLLFVNPFSVWTIIFLGFFIVPSFFWPLVLAAFNIAHVGFFGFLLVIARKKV